MEFTPQNNDLSENDGMSVLAKYGIRMRQNIEDDAQAAFEMGRELWAALKEAYREVSLSREKVSPNREYEIKYYCYNRGVLFVTNLTPDYYVTDEDYSELELSDPGELARKIDFANEYYILHNGYVVGGYVSKAGDFEIAVPTDEIVDLKSIQYDFWKFVRGSVTSPEDMKTVLQTVTGQPYEDPVSVSFTPRPSCNA